MRSTGVDRSRSSSRPVHPGTRSSSIVHSLPGRLWSPDDDCTRRRRGFAPNADELLENNVDYALSVRRRPPARPPQRRLAVVACMDSRMDIFEMLGLRHGEAHVIRNAGGVITDDVIRSLCVSQRYLGHPRDHPRSTTPTAGCRRSTEDAVQERARGRARASSRGGRSSRSAIRSSTPAVDAAPPA